MRYEIKYAIKNMDADLVRQVIRLHPGGFRKTYPDRQINNIYFDSTLKDSFYANVDGVSERKKFRLRWYGSNLNELSDPIFEIKIKRNRLGEKVRKELPSMAFGELEQCKSSMFGDPMISKMMVPTLMNTYIRSYYGLVSGKFRLTVDSQLSFGQVHKERPNIIYKNLPLTILELKYEASADEEVDWIMQHLPFRQTKSSKYALGVRLLK